MFCGSWEDYGDKKNKNDLHWWINDDNNDDDNLNLNEKEIVSTKINEKNSENENNGKFEEMELTVNVDFDKIEDGVENFIENGLRKSRGFSYTPERLVKSKEYKILSPHFQFACIHSSMFRQKKLSELIDPNKIGGTNLQKIICPNILTIEDSNYFDSEKYYDFDFGRNQIQEGSFSSLISNFKELKTLSKEKVNHKFSSSEEENTSGIQSPGWSLDTFSDPTQAPSRSEDLEVKSEISTVLLDDAENLSEIQSKVKRLRDVNEDIQKDIGTLKDDFQNDEWKVNILLEEANNFRRDIQELKYLDDLMNLLRGELEIISLKTWPFIRNHVDPYSEEINLII